MIQRSRFLKSIFPFSDWTESKRLQLAKLLQKRYLPSNKIIVKQGAIPKEFFILEKGVCRVLREIAVPAKVLTILKAPKMPFPLSQHSSNPNPFIEKRRTTSASLALGKTPVFGLNSWRCPLWREPPLLTERTSYEISNDLPDDLRTLIHIVDRADPQASFQNLFEERFNQKFIF